MSKSTDVELPPGARVRLLRADELDAAYGIYLGAVGWLREAGIRQWLTAMPRARFEARQERAENFGLFVDDELAAIFSIVRELTPYWRDALADDAVRSWLSTLVVAERFRGSRLGASVVRGALRVLRERAEPSVYLDCVDGGFLPEFYRRFGFVVLARKSVTYASGDTYPMVLMKRDLSLASGSKPDAP